MSLAGEGFSFKATYPDLRSDFLGFGRELKRLFIFAVAMKQRA